MIQVVLAVFIVAVTGAAPTAGRFPGATEVFRQTFAAAADQNFDQWPDNWTRRRGPHYPHYIKIEIQPDGGPNGTACLRIDLDGGGAAALSPALPIDPQFSYVVEADCRTEGLTHDQAFLSLTFLDEKQRPLETVESARTTSAAAWTRLRQGPVGTRNQEARFAMIGLHLEPKSPGGLEDLRGRAAFAEVWLGRLPRVVLATGRASNLFGESETVELTATASGLPKSATLTLQLADVLGRSLAQIERGLEPAGATAHRIVWKPPLPGPGFYRVRAQIKGWPAAIEQGVALAVLERFESPVPSPFGWNLPQGERPLGLAELEPLLGEAGIGWVKLPMWFAPAECEKAIDRLLPLAERLESRGIHVAGVLGDPPVEVRKRLPAPKWVTAADVFGSPAENWQTPLQPILTRLAGQVRWWQLGRDRDSSFVGYPDLPAKIEQARTALARLGGDVNVGLPWRWIDQFPPAAKGQPACQFLALSAEPPLAADELGSYLDATAGTAMRRWVDLEPLARGQYSPEARAEDLARRMIAAKIHRAEAVFLSDPFDAERGLLAADGTPTELFPAWRTAAFLLTGAEYLGSIGLPGGSANWVFSRRGEALLIAWNERPAQESLYLGPNVRQRDLWGRPEPVATRDREQVLSLASQPVYVTGLHLPIARWRMDMSLAQARIPSICGQAQPNTLGLANHFAEGVSGRAVIVGPQGWTIEPRQLDLRLSPGERVERPFRITLAPDATSGRQLLRVDFQLTAERAYAFSAYRPVDVGLGDVYIEIRTCLDAKGQLVVQQRLTNNSARKVSFRCQLFAPARQREKIDVWDLAPGQDARTYTLPDGAELVGHTLWLRAEEIDGPRTLNYRFAAER